MLRLTNTLKKLNLDLINSANLQSVRWRRKPIVLGTAKSKKFRIPTRPVIPVEEREELKRLFNNYRTQMKSLKRYLYDIYGVEKQQSVDMKMHEEELKEDFIKCSKINDEWNEAVKHEREEYFKRSLESHLVEIKQKIEDDNKLRQMKLEEAEKIIREQKALSKTFITKDNLDEALDKAMALEVDHNFAIDLEGNRIVGRRAKPKSKLSVKQ